ncbi:MAG: hypothetical protein BWY70_01007 [Bacteroidetes bacterium ADurb.Bin408]|nr:MAG: hypothetical protein BWY70_01007 [Bacteroidetes bacterium ADurb.Bin408]
MAKKVKLETTFEHEGLSIIGINSTMPDYKLIWNLNNSLKLNFVKEEDFVFETLRTKEKCAFSYYCYNDCENFKTYYFLSNNAQNRYIIDEYKNMNFLLMVKGNNQVPFINDVIVQVKNIKNVLLTLPLDLSKVKHLELILNDFELFIMDLNLKKKKIKATAKNK